MRVDLARGAARPRGAAARRACSFLTSGCIATPVDQTHAPNGMTSVLPVAVLNTSTSPLRTAATRLFSTSSMPPLPPHGAMFLSRPAHTLETCTRLRDAHAAVPAPLA